MSHPAASVKSIFSGKINLNSTDTFPYQASNNSSMNPTTTNSSTVSSSSSLLLLQSIDNQTSNTNTLLNISPSLNDFDTDSNYSISSRNLNNLNNKLSSKLPIDRYNNNNNDTNISLASSNSTYQSDVINDDEDDNSDYLDPFSRPISRNSTTSCLSTTATKDGIEGKKLHRFGPTAYSSNIISNMMYNQSRSKTSHEKPNLSHNEDVEMDN